MCLMYLHVYMCVGVCTCVVCGCVCVWCVGVYVCGVWVCMCVVCGCVHVTLPGEAVRLGGAYMA